MHSREGKVIKPFSSLYGTVEKLKKGKLGDSPPSPRQLAKQVACLIDGFGLLADALLEQSETIQIELGKWQIQRESWSRSMDQMACEMGCRMNEVDRLRAEANCLLQAARVDAASAAKDEFHGLSSRIDDIHRQSLLWQDNMQAQIRDFSSSITACEKMSSIQQEVWDLQRWRDVDQPQLQTDMLVKTMEELIRSHTTHIMETIAPAQLRQEIADARQEGHKASIALAKDVRKLAEALQGMRRDNQIASKEYEGLMQSLDGRLGHLEDSNPHSWLGSLQDELESIKNKRTHYEKTIEEVIQTILAEISRLSSEMCNLGSKRDAAAYWPDARERSNKLYSPQIHKHAGQIDGVASSAS